MRKPVQHGNYSSYVTGCRCDKCREANKIYVQKYRQLIQYRLTKVHSDV